jgi:hypothetical protein
MRLKQDVVCGGGKVTRPVQAKEGTGIGKKITASLELVLQGRSANALARGGVGTESAWKEAIAIALGMKRAMRRELEYLVQLKNSLSGVTYAAFRKVTGVAYYLHRAKGIGRYSRSNTLYRPVHLRVASHALAQRTCHFEGGGSAMCPCGNWECEGEETAAYFLFGCPTTEGMREAFYRADKRIRGAVKADKFRKFEVAVKYMTAMWWLDGGTGMREADFDAWLTALLDMLSQLLRVHPRWC